MSLLLTRPSSPSFRFVEPGPLVDGELELVAPHAAYVDDFVRTCEHPFTRREPGTGVGRQQLMDFLRAAPGGRQPGDPSHGRPPSYHFWMRIGRRPFASRAPLIGLPPPCDISIVGTINLRVGRSPDLEMYLGHIGYHVYPPARGRHYAERACRLLFPLARAHGLSNLWITCNPDNIGSRRTCERLGGVLVDTVPLPPGHLLYQRGERVKCRYRIDL
jgi:tagatose 1,6-diphosphate aldolase